jgi:hypothetical protein
MNTGLFGKIRQNVKRGKMLQIIVTSPDYWYYFYLGRSFTTLDSSFSVVKHYCDVDMAANGRCNSRVGEAVVKEIWVIQ